VVREGLPIFEYVDTPVFNNAGEAAFRVVLQTGPNGLPPANDQWLWFNTAGGGITPLLVGGSRAPGTPAEVVFDDLQDPVLNDAGVVAFAGDLKIGAGGVDSDNDEGVWTLSVGGAGALVARSGEVAFMGMLRTGVGGVTNGDRDGIWRGQDWIAREGSQAGGVSGGWFGRGGGLR